MTGGIMFRRMLNLTIVLCAAHAPLALADDLAKEGSFTVTYYLSGITLKSFDIGNGKSVALRAAIFVSTNDSGKGLFNDMTANCIQMTGTDDVTGYCVVSDKGADKFVESWHRKLNSAIGDGTLGWGTGKYQGIEGSLEWEVVTALPNTGPETFHLIGKKRGHYKLP